MPDGVEEAPDGQTIVKTIENHVLGEQVLPPSKLIV